MEWLLLLHQIPPKPPYFRAKVLRRLNQIGALAIKNSAYVLPASEDTLEDLQWLRQEIEKDGGEAWLFRTEVVAGLSGDAIREAFRAVRAPDYKEVSEAARSLLALVRNGSNKETDYEAEWRKVGQRLAEIRKIDFFEAPGRHETETIMESIDQILHTPPKRKSAKPKPQDLKGFTWVTRTGVKIDRIASAWLIRRFIDRAARFSFVDPKTYIYTHKAGEVRFDMFEGEFTHEDDQCTFEVLLAWSGLKDRALRHVAEVVHDIDLKDSKFGRVEAAGIAVLIEGITLRQPSDARRLEEGTPVFEALYLRFKAGR